MMHFLQLTIFLAGLSITQAIDCDPLCGAGVYPGICDETNGRCSCWYGWTGPNALYVSPLHEIQADYCGTPCHYTHDYRNVDCAGLQIPTVATPIDEEQTCHKRCNNYVLFHYGQKCLDDGRCLCHYGFTGPGSKYIDVNEFDGFYAGLNRIAADFCDEPCHYTHDSRNEDCVVL